MGGEEDPRQTTGAACEQIKVIKAKMSPGTHLVSALSRDPLTSERRRHGKKEKVSRVQLMGGGGWASGRTDGWADGWVGWARRKDVKEESGRVESGDQEVEGKFSVKVFANKGITMQRSLCASPPPPTSSVIVTHSIHPFPSPALLSVSLSLCFYC